MRNHANLQCAFNSKQVSRWWFFSGKGSMWATSYCKKKNRNYCLVYVDNYAVRRPNNASIETWRQKTKEKWSLNGEENRRKHWSKVGDRIKGIFVWTSRVLVEQRGRLKNASIEICGIKTINDLNNRLNTLLTGEAVRKA